MPLVASKIVHAILTGGLTVSENSIRVHNILMANAAAFTKSIVLTDIDGNTLLKLTAASGDSAAFETVWLAINGLVIPDPGGAVYATVIYSEEG